ncbi:MAG: metal-dependent transcriptional regulator [candidate division WOR-3 bacterium]
MLAKTHINRTRPLGQSCEDYLEAILVLERKGKVVRVRDVARFLEVSRPSVVAALAGLQKKGLVEHEHYGGVELTARGRALASAIDRRHRLIEDFLRDVLGVSDRVAAQDACRLEHALSAETAERLAALVRRLKRQRQVRS